MRIGGRMGPKVSIWCPSERTPREKRKKTKGNARIER